MQRPNVKPKKLRLNENDCVKKLALRKSNKEKRLVSSMSAGRSEDVMPTEEVIRAYEKLQKGQ